ncbi:dicarboxylate/amino acid:cation symporter [Halocatena pleomorpha]|uniref:Dicarboxylate/amino acid:cation symporter n=1 Tax=Halocatena pleomorpha TaxID=1785090 RepID=A0A3P3RHU2_9EURY|nr:dicarboxylate/amino acid:cation symporter [Halocatena pleomorpha]RRJ32518.1 dicarboxylate/amino acid:cation symporter [Halocatena pleomorpha]
MSDSEFLVFRLWHRYHAVPIVYRLAISFVLGTVVAFSVGAPASRLAPLGDLFLNLLEMIVVPVVIFSLLAGVRRLSPRQMGRVGGIVLGLYAVTTAVAASIGLAVANLLSPGQGVVFTGGEAQSAQPPSINEVLLGIVPTNPVSALANGDLLSIIFFVIVFGIALAIARDRADEAVVQNGAETFFELAEAGMNAVFILVWGVMEYGVIGVFALVASELAGKDVGAILALGSLVAVVFVGVLIHITVTYLAVIVGGLVGESPLAFLRGAKNAMITAFSIRSSSATLPVTMTDAEERLRIDESVYGFSLPLGSTANMDGAAIRQAVTVVFAANVVGQPLGLGDQVAILLVTVLISIGTAGVPGAGLIMLTIVLQQAGLPLTVVGFVAAVDPVLGRIATMNNVTGDLAVSTIAAKWTGAIDLQDGVWTTTETGSSPPSVADE